MSVMWEVMRNIIPLKPIQAPMLVFHFLLFYTAIAIIAHSLYPRSPHAAYSVLLMVLAPHVLCIIGVIWKDVGMAFAYLFAAAMLIRVTLHGWRHRLTESAIIFVSLFYAVSIKYQAQFILPTMVCWWVWLLELNKNYQKIVLALSLWASVMMLSQALTYYLIDGPKGQNNAWQQVKIFDLALISKALDQDLFPAYFHENPKYDFTAIKAVSGTELVDPMLHLVTITKEQAKLASLQIQWQNQVMQHPLLYLKLRLKVWLNMLKTTYPIIFAYGRYVTISANQPYVTENMANNTYQIKQAHNFFSKIQTMYLRILVGTKLGKIIVIFFVSIGLMFWSWINMNKDKRLAVAIIALQISSISLLTALCFFSLATNYRYGYASVLLTIFAIPLAIALWESKGGAA